MTLGTLRWRIQTNADGQSKLLVPIHRCVTEVVV
jgi:hypothetical protein